jgi:signal transduction histidine kinase
MVSRPTLIHIKNKIFTLGLAIFCLIIVILSIFIFTTTQLKLIEENKNHFLDKVSTLESVISKNTDITIMLRDLFKLYSNQVVSEDELTKLRKAIRNIRQNDTNKQYFTIRPNSGILNFTSHNTFISPLNTRELDRAFIQNYLATLKIQTFQQVAHKQVKSLVASYYMDTTAPNNMLSFYPYIPINKILENFNTFTQFTNEAYRLNAFAATAPQNRNKDIFWSQPYLDPAGNGLMVSCNAPIFNNKFDAIIGTDITLDFLNQFVEKSISEQGESFIISSKDYVINGTNINYKKATDLIVFDDLLQKHGGEDKFFIYKKSLNSAPWQFVYIISKRALIIQTLKETQYYNLFFMLSLLTAFISYIYIRKYFVLPGIIAEKDLKESNDNLINIKITLENNLLDLKNAQQKIVETEKLASLGTLVTGVAHEINTPTGIAITAGSLIHEKSVEFQSTLDNNAITKNKLSKFIQTIRQSSELLNINLNRIDALVNDFTSISASSNEYNLSTFNFQLYLNNIINVHKSLFSKGGHQVIIKCDDIMIESYKDVFNQIFITLLENSVIHGFKKTTGGIINIEFKEHDDNLELTYSDNGSGITFREKGKIFDPFYSSAKDQGKGLGLFTIHNIIKEVLHGDIYLNEDAQVGISFTINWPKQ